MIKVYQLRKKQNSYEVVLNYKGVKVKVSFTDGNTYKGIYPKFYTNDPFRQRAVEASQLYKDKEVVLNRVIEEPGDAEKKTPAAMPQGMQSQRMPTESEAHSQGAALQGQQGIGEAAGKDSGMEFANLAEAIVYVATTYGVQVQTANEARKVLSEHGVKATIHK